MNCSRRSRFDALLAVAAGVALTMPAFDCAAYAMMDIHLIGAAAESAVRAAVGTTGGTLEIQSAPLDPRLRLAACDQPLQAFLTGAGEVRRQNTVGVRCEGSIHWTIYTSVTVDSRMTVLVARHPLAVGEAPGAADLQPQVRVVPGLPANYVTDPKSLAGQRLRRSLLAGEPVTYDLLAPAVLIHRGQEVQLLARADGIEVQMNGVALGDGSAAERIRVENLSSQRIVEGIVRSDHLVEIPL